MVGKDCAQYLGRGAINAGVQSDVQARRTKKRMKIRSERGMMFWRVVKGVIELRNLLFRYQLKVTILR